LDAKTVPLLKNYEKKVYGEKISIRRGPVLHIEPRIAEVRYQVVYINPLIIRFSQRAINSSFKGNIPIDQTAGEITFNDGTRNTPGDEKRKSLLEVPFDPIKCLQVPTALPENVVDKLGIDLRGIYTLDNRRLCAMQKKAVEIYPENCVIEVHLFERIPSDHIPKFFDVADMAKCEESGESGFSFGKNIFLIDGGDEEQWLGGRKSSKVKGDFFDVGNANLWDWETGLEEKG